MKATPQSSNPEGTYAFMIMNKFRALLLTAVGGLTGMGLGCIISVGPLDCSECGNTGCDSQLSNGQCVCDPGHEWANPDDDADFECDRIPPKPGDETCGGIEDNPVHSEGDVCVCDSGFNWCTDDPADLSCCPDNDQAPETGNPDPTGTDPGTGTGTDTTEGADETVDDTGQPMMCMEVDAEWNGVEPDAADCDEAGEGFVFCSNNEAEGPAGSRYWECTGGAWMEFPSAGDENCALDGLDFAYGCVDNGNEVEFVCGSGPGTGCSGPECDGCGDDGDQILFCVDGKLGADSCNEICTVDGDDQGVTYDFGECVIDGDVAQCACCDSGDEGCPV